MPPFADLTCLWLGDTYVTSARFSRIRLNVSSLMHVMQLPVSYNILYSSVPMVAITIGLFVTLLSAFMDVKFSKISKIDGRELVSLFTSFTKNPS